MSEKSGLLRVQPESWQMWRVNTWARMLLGGKLLERAKKRPSFPLPFLFAGVLASGNQQQQPIAAQG